MSQPHLQEIVDESRRITAAIIDANGELTPEMEQALALINFAVGEKLDSFSAVIDRLGKEAEYWAAEAESRKKIAKSLESMQDKMKERIRVAMTEMGKSEITGDQVKWALNKQGEKTVIAQPELIPQNFKLIVTTTEIDKKKITDALKDGFTVPGAHLEPIIALRKKLNRKD